MACIITHEKSTDSLVIITWQWSVFSKFSLFCHHFWCYVVWWDVFLYVDLFLNYSTQDLAGIFNLNALAFFNSGKFSNIISSDNTLPLFCGICPRTTVEINWNIPFFLSQLSHFHPFIWFCFNPSDFFIFVYHFISLLFSTVQHNCLNICF